MAGKLKLRAHDPADLAVISAHLQDALVPLRDMTWLPAERRFVLLANRFRWESEPEASPPDEPDEQIPARDAKFAETSLRAGGGRLYSRVVCGLCFDRVTAVKRRDLDPENRSRLLSLLALKPERGAIRLVFAGKGEIRLETARIAVHLEDLGEAWPTQWRPSHSLDDRGSAG